MSIVVENPTYTWENVKQDLKDYYGDNIYNNWFVKISYYKIDTDAHEVILSAPTHFIRDWIKTQYLNKILSYWRKYDNSLEFISIITIPNNPNNLNNTNSQNSLDSSNLAEKNYTNHSEDKNAGFKKNVDQEKSKQHKIEHNYTASKYKSENDNYDIRNFLDERLTFNNFVIGKSNQLAYSAALAVAESNNSVASSNPLFLYGGVGLGKTHLMHSIAWYILERTPHRKVLYMSAEKFMYSFIKALRNKDVISFKNQFRSVDVLMIDDIQFICGKESTQEEFFHTFNAIIDNNKQMVISCDRSPSDLDNIEERIKSRLGWGLVTDVHSTTYELRIGILESKIDQMRAKIPQNVIEFLASKITSNVRELEGALNKVIAFSTLMGKEITLDSAKELLKDLLNSHSKNITIDMIQKKVSQRYNIKISDIFSSKRSRVYSRPRQIAMYLCKHLTSKSLAEIGVEFRKKDHTTVIHAIKNIEKLIDSDPEIKKEIESLIEQIQ